MPDLTEKNFEESIEAALLRGGPDDPTPPGRLAEQPGMGEYTPGGWRKRSSQDYDKTLCLLPQDVLGFLQASQPKEWQRYSRAAGQEAESQLLARLGHELAGRGVLDVLRNGLNLFGVRFKLCFFPPASRLNPELQNQYRANRFCVVRQLKYSRENENCLDVVLFLNGLPLFTVELKNPETGQSVADAVNQYRTDRDPREPLLAFRRCLAHFAVDSEEVYFTTRLEREKTRFIPFNRGNAGGKGNPPSRTAYATAYLWDQIWAPESVLNLLQYFIHEYELEDDNGRPTGKKELIFPRYHQLDAVRRIINHARRFGTGQKYLVQHSAGSGKSNSIAWLAHQLAVLHNDQDRAIFDSVIVITDRRVLDRQLQRTVRQFEQTRGLVENIDTTSRQLRQALQDGKKIIVTTLQKFPVVFSQIQELSLSGSRFAVIMDEAHSSQAGESPRKMNAVLAARSLEEAEQDDLWTEEDEANDLQNRILAEIRRMGRLDNISYFAFTATPKPQTLEMFGTKQPDGSFRPFSLYSMRQAIEEGFILDVLQNYTTYHAYWNLLKKIESDPRYDRQKAGRLLQAFVELHDHTIEKKIQIMLEHFSGQVAGQIGGKAKAMIVTRSRLHAVRYFLKLQQLLREGNYPYKALAAFSGTVRDPDTGIEYTEAGLNGFPENQTAEKFKTDEYRFLVVAEKFQTGFDQPLLQTMYVDKRLRGLHAVQTLSRLNRVHPGKRETFVLDFANEADDICKAFEPYYDRTTLTQATDPNLLYDLESKLAAYQFYEPAELQRFAVLYYDPRQNQHAKIHNVLQRAANRCKAAEKKEQTEFRELLNQYIRLYAYLSQIMPFEDDKLEVLYQYGRLLLRLIHPEKERLPVEVTREVDLSTLRVQKTGQGKIKLHNGKGALEPETIHDPKPPDDGDLRALSEIIQELNQRYGTDFKDSDRLNVALQHIEEVMANDERVLGSLEVNPPELAMLTFAQVLHECLQDMVDTHFQFYKQVNDNEAYSRDLTEFLFKRLQKSHPPKK